MTIGNWVVRGTGAKGLAILVLALSVCSQTLVWQGRAATYTLSDGNTSAIFDPASSGLTSWQVDSSLNQLKLQSFWYRTSGGNNQSLTALGTPTVSQSSPDALTATYSGSLFNVTLKYSITDFGNGSGDMAESIRILNKTGSPLALSFFQFSDFDMNGTASGDTAVLGTDSVTGKFSSAYQSKGPLSSGMAGVNLVDTPGADLGEVDTTGSLLGRLGSGTYNLNADNIGPATGDDVSWALQWNLSIPGSGSQGISEDNLLTGVLVPEPSAFALLGLGALALGLRRRKRAS